MNRFGRSHGMAATHIATANSANRTHHLAVVVTEMHRTGNLGYSDLRRFITSKTFKRPTEGPAEGSAEGSSETSSINITINPIDPEQQKEDRKRATKQISAVPECTLRSARLIYTTSNATAQKPYKQHYKAARAVMIGDRERDSVQSTGLTIERYEKTGEQLATE
ncbi:hypothetical protein ACHAPM_001518 [Fusarium culmorum]